MRCETLFLTVLTIAVSPLAAQVDSTRSVPAHAPTADDLIGTWQLAKMETMRHSQPTDAIAGGVRGSITFGRDGSMVISMEEPSGTTDTVRGTYALEGAILTMTIENQSAKGSVQRDGDRLILHFTSLDDEPVELEWILTKH